MKDILQKLQSEKLVIGSRVNTNWKQINQALGEEAIAETNTASLSQALYNLLHNLSCAPNCHCGKHLKFIGDGYRKFCSRQCSGSALSTLENRFKTNTEKFGVRLPALSKEIVKKANKTRTERYGEKPEYLFGGARYKQTMMEKYGVDNPAKKQELYLKHKGLATRAFTERMQAHLANHGFSSLQEELHSLHPLRFKHHCGNEVLVRVWSDRIPRCKVCQPEVVSAQHLLMRDFLIDNNIEFFENDRNIIKPLELDFYIPSKKLAIEINGAYWHSENAGTPRNYHQRKTLLCHERGVTLIHVFEDKMTVSPSDIFEKLKQNYLDLEPTADLIFDDTIEVDGSWPLPQQFSAVLIGCSEPEIYCLDKSFRPKIAGLIWGPGKLFYNPILINQNAIDGKTSDDTAFSSSSSDD